MSGPGRNEAPEGRRSRWPRILLRIAVSSAFLGALLWNLPRGILWAAVERISWFQWGIGLAAFFAGHFFGVLKWWITLGVSGVRLPWADVARCYCAGLFANLCLPSIVGGDVLRAGLAMRITGRKEAIVVGSLLDRLVDVLALTLLVLGGGLMGSGFLDPRGGALLAVVASGIGAMMLTSILLVRMRPPSRWPGRARRRVARARVALRAVGRRTHLAAAALGLGMGVQAGFVLLNAFLGVAIGLQVPLYVWFLTWPLAKLVALVPISLGGLGVREVALAGLLLPFGVPAALAVAQSLLWETILIAGGLSAGLIWWGMGLAKQTGPLRRTETALLFASGVFRGHEPAPASREVPAARPVVKGESVS